MKPPPTIDSVFVPSPACRGVREGALPRLRLVTRAPSPTLPRKRGGIVIAEKVGHFGPLGQSELQWRSTGS
jgi:hypothetical protein